MFYLFLWITSPFTDDGADVIFFANSFLTILVSLRVLCDFRTLWQLKTDVLIKICLRSRVEMCYIRVHIELLSVSELESWADVKLCNIH